MVVNRYIGVSGGYLGDFSYRTHDEFYPEYCDVEIETFSREGTTRERFISILASSAPVIQARILRGVLKKYPVGSSALRTPDRVAEIEQVALRLEKGATVDAPSLRASSDVVNLAISDAEALLKSNGAPSGVDRMHTAFHGFLRVLCDRAQLPYGADPSITELFKMLRSQHPNLQDKGPHSQEIDRVIKSFASAVDSLNTLRNRASIAHPNDQVLENEEALLYINAVRTLMAYLDAKLGK